jgi:hypothetical protein
MAAKHNQAKYVLYPRMSDNVLEQMRRGGEQFNRKSSLKEVLKTLVVELPDFIHSLDWKILSEEYFVKRQGSHIILPESTTLLNTILKGEIPEPTKKFSLPFDGFTVAAPKRYSFKGIELPGFQVVMMPYLKAKQFTIHPWHDYLEIPRPDGVISDEAGESDRCLALTYRDDSDMGYVRSLVTEDKFGKILRCETMEEYREIVGDISTFETYTLNERELSIQWLAFKLVIGIGTRFGATDGECITPGFPGTTPPQLLNRRPEHNPQYSTFR